jgi:peptidoglycan endopeptidase LytF
MPSIRRSDLAAACGIAALALGISAPLLRHVLHPVRLVALPNGTPLVVPDAAPPVSIAEVNRSRAAIRRQDVPGEKGEITHRFQFPGGAVIAVSDHPKKPAAKAHRKRVVAFRGSAPASTEPTGTFETAGRATGLSTGAVEALEYVSRHEGGFDAVNTWDSARFSWGFVQFAGGYGLPGALAYIKATDPVLFRSQFQVYGIDVVPGASGQPTCAYLDPATHLVKLGAKAEQGFGDDLLAVACFVRAGQNPAVKERQVEVAIRSYVEPALKTTHHGIRLSSVLSSPKGLAALIDQQVQVGNQRRLGRALQAALVQADPRFGRNPVALERSVLHLAVKQTGKAVNTRRMASAIHNRLTDILYSELPGPI